MPLPATTRKAVSKGSPPLAPPKRRGTEIEDEFSHPLFLYISQRNHCPHAEAQRTQSSHRDYYFTQILTISQNNYFTQKSQKSQKRRTSENRVYLYKLCRARRSKAKPNLILMVIGAVIILCETSALSASLREDSFAAWHFCDFCDFCVR